MSIAPTSREAYAAACRGARRKPTYDQLERALRLAVNMLMVHEPPDSRGVSDEVVALAAVEMGDGSDKVMAVIDNALKVEV